MSAAARVALERIALEEGPSATNTDSLLGNRDHCALHGDVRRPGALDRFQRGIDLGWYRRRRPLPVLRQIPNQQRLFHKVNVLGDHARSQTGVDGVDHFHRAFLFDKSARERISQDQRAIK